MSVIRWLTDHLAQAFVGCVCCWLSIYRMACWSQLRSILNVNTSGRPVLVCGCRASKCPNPGAAGSGGGGASYGGGGGFAGSRYRNGNGGGSGGYGGGSYGGGYGGGGGGGPKGACFKVRRAAGAGCFSPARPWLNSLPAVC